MALKDINLQIRDGEFVGLIGKSGSGKSTLLNMIGGIDRPSSGAVEVGNTSVQDLKENKLAHWRGRTVGFVFQFFQLLPTLTAAENVMLPMDFCKTFPVRERRQRAVSLLERVGVGQQADNCRQRYPAENNSASQSPAHSLTNQQWFWRMNQPVISIQLPLKLSSISFEKWRTPERL